MHNAARTILRVIEDALSIENVDVEVIVVDDNSTDGSAQVVGSLKSPRVQLVPLERNCGAGTARNVGFRQARGEYCLFFDADDELSPQAVSTAVDLLESSGADLAFFPYLYRRGHSTEYVGMNSYDQRIWTRYVETSNPQQSKAERPLQLTEAPELLGFSNYPWNKVFRTHHYRAKGLHFSQTPVHNDIFGHWQTLLGARNIILGTAPICTHIVAESGSNLTNHRSSVRLSLFDALEETYDHLEKHPDLRNRYSHHYWDFALRVIDWAKTRIDDDHLVTFNSRTQDHLLRMNLLDYQRMRQRRNPRLASRILQRTIV